MGYGLSLHTAPTLEPITLDEARKQCEVTHLTHHDAYLTTLILAARRLVELRLNRQLMTATWNLVLDRFPCGIDPILIPYAPLASITSITYLDSDGTSQTWSSASYRVTTTREPGRVVPVYGGSYPATRATTDAVTVRFVAGYTSAANVPAGIKAAILLLITHWFENRTPIAEVNRELPFSLEALLMAHGYGDEFVCYSEASY